MKKIAGILVMLCTVQLCTAQNILVTVIRDVHSNKPIKGMNAVIATLNIRGISDSAGVMILTSIPTGTFKLVVTHPGYQDFTKQLSFPYNDTLFVMMDEVEEDTHDHHEKLEEIVVNSTRSSRTIQQIPTRVEFIAGEELEEKGNMKPGDIRMLLNESTGIQTQQVSATSANASIRIQGLDGRYTQLLRDGFPMYAGFSGGLGLLQTPPLDLKQVEIIKGASSTLYGGGAIAGLVNLISKMPAAERETRLLLNGTSAGGIDLSGFHAQQHNKLGYTFFAAGHASKPYDPSKQGFTAIPKTQRLVLNPKLFLDAGARTKLTAGVNLTWENRVGGDIEYIKGRGSSTRSYFEENKTSRITTQLQLVHKLNDNEKITAKNSVTSFSRTITIPSYVFEGKQLSSYSELSYNRNGHQADWVAGLNAYTDQFKEYPRDAFPRRNYNQHALGGFIQNTLHIAAWMQMETGLRADYTSLKKLVILPRMSALFRLSPAFSSRIGGGFGYKMPTIFTEETEMLNYRNIIPLNQTANELERSYGANADLNYTSKIGEIGLQINQLFFYTRINQPLFLQAVGAGNYGLQNSSGFIDTKGWETNVKVSYADLKLFIGYTYTDAGTQQNSNQQPNFLTARHRLNNVLMCEVEGKWKMGLEAYYFSSQQLRDGSTGKPYWICGFMAEKLWQRFSLFLNFENFTDTRQTRFGSINAGTITQPIFRDIYAPLDGFVVNGGLKWRL